MENSFYTSGSEKKLIIARIMVRQLYNFMILPINSERTEIFSQIKTIDKVRARLSGELLHLKEFNHVKVLFKLIESHLAELQTGEREAQEADKAVSLTLYLQANTRIKNQFARKLHQVKQLINDHRYEVYANLVIQCLANIVRCLSSIEWKLEEVGRFQREGSLDEKAEILIGE